MASRRTRGSGLNAPRVTDAGLQRFIEGVAQSLRRLDEKLGGLDSRVAGLGAGAGGTPGGVVEGGGFDDEIPTLPTAPVPSGFTATGGFGMVLLWWDNPFVIYRNHSLTQVFRGTDDVFGNATQIGMSDSVSYLDLSVASDTTYFYWIRWVTTSNVVGPPSDPAEARTALDPREAIQSISNEILADPLAELLLSPVRFNSAAFARLMDRVARYQALSATLFNNVLAANLDTRVVEIDRVVASLEASSGESVLGPEQNTFTANTRPLAEVARDDYATANPGWLAMYDENPSFHIQLEWS